jgi:putative transposase
MSHSYSTNLVHCVFSTKGWVDSIPDDIRQRLYAYLFGTAKNLGIGVLAMGGTANHIHILMALPAKCPLAFALRDLKANSSRWMSDNGKRWQEGFGGFSVSPSQAGAVKEYIRNQEAHHQKRSFEEEFLLLLKKSGSNTNRSTCLDDVARVPPLLGLRGFALVPSAYALG